MEIYKTFVLVLCLYALSSVDYCVCVEEMGTKPSPDCPKNCDCTEDFLTLKCYNSFTVKTHGLLLLTKHFHLSRNFIGPVLNGTFKHLNGLTFINMSDSQINFVQSGALAGLTELKTLILAGNSIQLLPEHLFKDNIHLEVLDLSRNKIGYLPDEPFRYLTSLRVLNVSYNHLVSARLGVRFQVPTRLEVLDFTGNNIEHVTAQDLAPAERWDTRTQRHVNFSNCALKTIEPEAITKFPNLHFLGLAYNIDLSFENITSYLQAMQEVQLKSIDISFTNCSNKINVTDINQDNLVALPLHELFMAGNGFETIDDNLLSFLSLKKLDLSHNKLVALGDGIAKLYNLQHLDLSFNQIATVGEMFKDSVGNIEFLNIGNNNLSDSSNLNLEKATKAVEIHLDHNLFENFVIPRELEKLQILNLAGCKIHTLNNELPLAGLSSLKHLDLSGNKLKSVHHFMFRDSRDVEYVSFAENEIETISHQAFQPNCPKVLDLSRNRLSEIHLYGWHNVRKIFMGQNVISEIEEQTFFSLLTLEQLDLHGNALSDLPVNVFAHLTNLTVLDLHMNNLSQAIPLAEILAPVGNLRRIDLSDNSFSDFSMAPSPFAHNYEISHVSISRNKIRIFNPGTFSVLEKLESLDLSRNPFHCGCENVGMQSWLKHTRVHIQNRENLGYICHSPNMRGTQTLMNYEVKMFECNRRLFFIVLFSSIGAGAMVIAVSLATMCYCVKRRRRGKMDLQSKEESLDLVEHEKVETAKESEAVTPDEYIRSIRNNYLKGSRSDTLIDVEFENPNLLLDGDVLEKKVEKSTVKNLPVEKKKQKPKQKPRQQLVRSSQGQSLDLKKLRYYAHMYDSLRHAKKRNQSTLKNIKKKDKEKLKKLLDEMDKEYKGIEKKRQKKSSRSERKGVARKRRPRGNRDLIRIMSTRHSRSMPDVLSYVNSLPRHWHHDRDSRYQRIPIYHIDYSDPRASRGWLKSMVDIPRAHRSADNYDRHRVKDGGGRDPRLPSARLDESYRYDRIPLGYHTVTSGYRSPIIHSKMMERSRSMGIRPSQDNVLEDERWIQNGHTVRDARPSIHTYARERSKSIPNGHIVHGSRSGPKEYQLGSGTSENIPNTVDVDETEPKTRLLIKDGADDGHGQSQLGYHTIASTRGVTLKSDRHPSDRVTYSRLDRAKSASTDGHLSQWV